MRKQKAKSWEMISEGIVKIDDIEQLLARKSKAIALPLLEVNATPGVLQMATIDIVLDRGKYVVVNNTTKQIHGKKYKYLSCAVRLAVKDYKAALRTGKWRLLSK